MTMNVVEYIFDRDVNRPDLTNSLLNFSGLMVIRDWNNNFLGGLVYKKNQVVGAASQLGVFKGNPPASAPNTTRPNGRTALQTCVETQTCYYSYTYVPAYPQIGGYWHMDCTVDYKCYFGDLLSVPITGPIIPPGSSFSGGYTPTPGQITSYNDLNYEIVTTGLCKAFDRMYQVHLSSIDKCEVNAYIAKDGRVIILPTYQNENKRGIFFGEFVDLQQRRIVIAGPNPTSPHPFITLIDYSGSTPRETNVEVTGMIHTHPCKDEFGKPILPEIWDKPSMAIYNPQTGDTDGDTVIAGIYKNLAHYIVNCSNIIQFDASYNTTTNNVISKKSRSSCN